VSNNQAVVFKTPRKDNPNLIAIVHQLLKLKMYDRLIHFSPGSKNLSWHSVQSRSRPLVWPAACSGSPSAF